MEGSLWVSRSGHYVFPISLSVQAQRAVVPRTRSEFYNKVDTLVLQTPVDVHQAFMHKLHGTLTCKKQIPTKEATFRQMFIKNRVLDESYTWYNNEGGVA